jgi:hypothetical protein
MTFCTQAERMEIISFPTHRDKVMSVNTDTLCALQIFEAEDHANVNSNVKKEGLSLYSKHFHYLFYSFEDAH